MTNHLEQAKALIDDPISYRDYEDEDTLNLARIARNTDAIAHALIAVADALAARRVREEKE